MIIWPLLKRKSERLLESELLQLRVKYEGLRHIMDCPVCPRTDLPSEAQTCPNCGTDLAPVLRISELADQCFNEGLTRATKGEYHQALEKLLAGLVFDKMPTRFRLLIGKTLWHMDRPQEAVTQWRQVLDDEPSNLEANELIRFAQKELRKKRLNNLTVKLGSYGIVVLGLAVMLFITLDYRRNHLHTNTEVAILQERLGVEHNDLVMLSERLEARDTEVATLRERLQAKKSDSTPLHDAAEKIEGLGDQSNKFDLQEAQNLVALVKRKNSLRVDHERGTITISFLDGLFPSASDRLTTPAAALLASLGKLLHQHARPLRVVVDGITDNLSPSPKGRWSDNRRLGFARASSVIKHLSGYLDNSNVRLLATSSGESNPPFPNDTGENRRKNRTVVLHVSPDREGVNP